MQDPINYLTKVLDLNATHNVIIAGGIFPTNPYLIKLLSQAKVLLVCDGTPIPMLELYHRSPDYIIGDCDSLSDELQYKYANQIKYKFNQDYSDLAKTIYFCYTKLKLASVIILGATGKREDHSLANISLLMQYKDFIDLTIISDYGMFSIHCGECELITLPGQQISLFAVDNTTCVSSKGLAWELDNLSLNNWSSAILNQALGTSITLSSTKAIIVYRCFEIKTPLKHA